jgi:hypothetical protein
MGAIFSTGVALASAAIVVANPVSVPPSDVRVPAVKLSAGSTRSTAALDRALLEAITQDFAEPSPADLFKRSVAGVVANVTVLGGRAVEQALWAHPAVEGTPERAPSSKPQLPPEAVADLLSGKPENRPAANVPTPVIEDPALQHAVTSLADYVGYVSAQAVEATVATGTMAAAEPKLIADELAALANSDMDSVIAAALRTVAAPLGPPSMVVKALRTAIRTRLTELVNRLRPPLQTRPEVRPAAAVNSASDRVALGHRRGLAVTSKPAASADSDLPKPTKVNGTTDLTDGNKAVPHKMVPESELRQRVTASLNQARDSLERFGDSLRKAMAPHRSHRH